MKGERYLANMKMSNKVVHDLDNETNECRIDEIILSGYDQPYTSLTAALMADYKKCPHCIG
jgi:hypothetical protein